MTQQFKLQILIGLYVAAMIGANLLGTKIWEITYPEFLQNMLGFLDSFQFQIGQQTVVPFSSQTLSFSVGLFVFPFTFLITDIVGEVMGKKVAKQVFYVGLISLAMILLYTAISVAIPPAARYNVPTIPGSDFTKNEAYSFIFGSSIRIMVASFSAFAVAQLFDIWLFEKIRTHTKSRWLWLRNNGSTIASQFIDTVVFYAIAFAQIPFSIGIFGIEAGNGLPFDLIVKLFVPYYLLKVLVALFDTPFVYLGVWWLRGDSDVANNQEKA